MQNPAEQFLSIGEASEYLGVSIDTLRRWTKKAKITAYRSPGKHRYFKKSDLDTVFGTRYERDESKLHLLKKLTPQETTTFVPETPEVSPVASTAPEKIVDEDPSMTQVEEIDMISPIDELKKEETSPKEPEKRVLEVPQYIRHRTISKYDLLFAPKIAGEIEERIPEKPEPIAVEPKSFHSVLVPKIEEIIPSKPEIIEIKEDKITDDPKPRIVIESALESKSSKKDYSKFGKNLRNAFFAFLAIDAILFIYWFTTNRISSPLP